MCPGVASLLSLFLFHFLRALNSDITGYMQLCCVITNGEKVCQTRKTIDSFYLPWNDSEIFSPEKNGQCFGYFATVFGAGGVEGWVGVGGS